MAGEEEPRGGRGTATAKAGIAIEPNSRDFTFHLLLDTYCIDTYVRFPRWLAGWHATRRGQRAREKCFFPLSPPPSLRFGDSKKKEKKEKKKKQSSDCPIADQSWLGFFSPSSSPSPSPATAERFSSSSPVRRRPERALMNALPTAPCRKPTLGSKERGSVKRTPRRYLSTQLLYYSIYIICELCAHGLRPSQIDTESTCRPPSPSHPIPSLARSVVSKPPLRGGGVVASSCFQLPFLLPPCVDRGGSSACHSCGS